MNYAEAKASGFPAPKIKLTDDDLPRIANEIGCHEDVVHALMEVESGASSSDNRGRIKILFEPHVFYRNLAAAKRDQAVHAGVAYKKWGERPYPRDSYPNLFIALAIDEAAALKACSWGRSQILGENYKLAGYATVFDMVAGFCTDEDDHIEAMINFVKATKLDDDLRKIEEIAKTRRTTAADWAPIAFGYNGKGYASHNYHGRLANAFNKWQKIKDTPWDTKEALKVATPPDKKDAKDATAVVATPTVIASTAAAVSQGWSLWDYSLAILGCLLVFGLLYWFVIRPILRRVTALSPLLSETSSSELSLWGRIRLVLKGLKSKLWGRLIALSGLLAGLGQMAGMFDLTTILPAIRVPWTRFVIPSSFYVPTVILPLIAWINQKLADTRDATGEDVAKMVIHQEEPSLALVAPGLPAKFDRVVRSRKRLSQTRTRKRK